MIQIFGTNAAHLLWQSKPEKLHERMCDTQAQQAPWPSPAGCWDLSFTTVVLSMWPAARKAMARGLLLSSEQGQISFCFWLSRCYRNSKVILSNWGMCQDTSSRERSSLGSKLMWSHIKAKGMRGDVFGFFSASNFWVKLLWVQGRAQQ